MQPKPHLAAACFDSSRQAEKKTLTLEIDIWPDSSAAASVNNQGLPEFLKTANDVGRKRIIRMLRDAADLIERGVV